MQYSVLKTCAEEPRGTKEGKEKRGCSERVVKNFVAFQFLFFKVGVLILTI
jgi:hypothetical protein